MSIPEGENLENFSREQLIGQLQNEGRAQSAWTLFYHQAIADRLGLNTTDHKCLDLILHCGVNQPPMTPGQLARETKLTTGAVTSVLDRLERNGYVKREHDAEDRRRIIIRPATERIEDDVAPLFGCLEDAFREICAGYTDEELRFLIDFLRKTQSMLRDATDNLRVPAAFE